MNEVVRRNHYDVTDRVFVGDPRVVCAEVCALLRSLEPNTDLPPVEQAFDVFSRLYAATLPGYGDCETWYHDAQHSLDCALVTTRAILSSWFQRPASRPCQPSGSTLQEEEENGE